MHMRDHLLEFCLSYGMIAREKKIATPSRTSTNVADASGRTIWRERKPERPSPYSLTRKPPGAESQFRPCTKRRWDELDHFFKRFAHTLARCRPIVALDAARCRPELAEVGKTRSNSARDSGRPLGPCEKHPLSRAQRPSPNIGLTPAVLPYTLTNVFTGNKLWISFIQVMC